MARSRSWTVQPDPADPGLILTIEPQWLCDGWGLARPARKACWGSRGLGLDRGRSRRIRGPGGGRLSRYPQRLWAVLSTSGHHAWGCRSGLRDDPGSIGGRCVSTHPLGRLVSPRSGSRGGAHPLDPSLPTRAYGPGIRGRRGRNVRIRHQHHEGRELGGLRCHVAWWLVHRRVVVDCNPQPLRGGGPSRKRAPRLGDIGRPDHPVAADRGGVWTLFELPARAERAATCAAHGGTVRGVRSSIAVPPFERPILLGVRAEAAAITWLDEPTPEFKWLRPSEERVNEVMYLGEVDGTTFLFDTEDDAAIRVPSAKIALAAKVGSTCEISGLMLLSEWHTGPCRDVGNSSLGRPRLGHLPAPPKGRERVWDVWESSSGNPVRASGDLGSVGRKRLARRRQPPAAPRLGHPSHLHDWVLYNHLRLSAHRANRHAGIKVRYLGRPSRRGNQLRSCCDWCGLDDRGCASMTPPRQPNDKRASLAWRPPGTGPGHAITVLDRPAWPGRPGSRPAGLWAR